MPMRRRAGGGARRAPAAGGAAASAQAHFADRQVEVVVDDEQLARVVQPEASHQVRDGLAALVHEGARLGERDLLAGDLAPAQRCLAARVELDAVAACEPVHRPEADVVAVGGILLARVAEADDQPDGYGPLLRAAVRAR